MRLAKESIGAWSTDNLFYMSATWITRDNFGHCRLQRDILRAWMDQKLEFGGQQFACNPPDLSQEEIRSIPGGEAAMGSMDSLRWETLERSGTKLVIKQDEHRFWAAQTGEIAEVYATLKKQHDKLAEQFVGFGGASAEDSSTAAGGPAEASTSNQTEDRMCEASLEFQALYRTCLILHRVSHT